MMNYPMKKRIWINSVRFDKLKEKYDIDNDFTHALLDDVIDADFQFSCQDHETHDTYYIGHIISGKSVKFSVIFNNAKIADLFASSQCFFDMMTHVITDPGIKRLLTFQLKRLGISHVESETYAGKLIFSALNNSNK